MRKTNFNGFALFCLPACLLAAGLLVPGPEAEPKVPKVPARITIAVAPDSVAPGSKAEVRLEVEPVAGVKINRYPTIRLRVPAREGLVAAGEASVGNDRAPSPEEMRSGANYFKEAEPVQLLLDVDANAAPGEYELEGQLRYVYCVGKSFCAPKKLTVKIPLTVR